MEELKLLIGMVTDLPQMALWVLMGYLIYKLAIIGSIYGTIRFVAEKAHDYAIKRKELPPVSQEISFTDMLYGITISSDETTKKLMHQIKRVAGKGMRHKSDYIHGCSVDWLREAINAKIDADMAEKKETA
jgi:hypothetical protein